GLVGWPKTSGSRGMHINVRIEPRWTFPEVRRAALALARDVERRAPELATSKWWKEERQGVFLDYNQNAKDRTVASAYSVRPLPDARVSMPLRWDEVADVEAGDFTLVTVPALVAERGDASEGIDEAVGSLASLLELSARHEAEGDGDAPWPPHYAKQEGEPPRVRPSQKRRSAEDYSGRGVAGGPPPEVAEARRMAVAEGDPDAGISGPAPWVKGQRQGTRPTPTGRRRSSVPVIEIARAAHKDEALAGLERWKVRWPKASARLEPADVLVDSMRGRSTTWTRIRVNLQHVPVDERAPQESLDPDYDPWAGYEWPDRSGQSQRAPRKKS
ncbi:MAG: DNA primase, partial [Chloroflexota bacterium]|nr:DNA primase [Chloroflexota bacterium]